jgi:hypothetical protein
LIGEKIKEDNFIDICNITNMLTDYTLENEEILNEIVAINEEDDADEDGDDEEVVEDEQEVEVEEEEEEVRAQIKAEKVE